MKRKYMIIVLIAGALELTGCYQGTSNSAKNGTTGSENTIISESDIAILDTEDMFTERDRDTEYDESECTAISLSDEETKCDSDGVKMDGQTVTITEGGTYLLTGSLSNGSVVVDTDKTEKSTTDPGKCIHYKRRGGRNLRGTGRQSLYNPRRW